MPHAPHLEFSDRTHVRHLGRRLLYFAGCDYFRLSSHPAVRRALRTGLRTAGLTVAASRTTTGNHLLYARLERTAARFFQAEDAVLVSTGYATNLALAQALAGEITHAFIDERAHGSLQDATAFLRGPVQPFRHRDTNDLRRRLHTVGPHARPWVFTDGLFAHDGSLAPLREYLRALPRRGRLLVDDTHGAGLLGRHGRGTAEELGVADPRIIRTVTLSKAVGVYGGVILGSRELTESVRTTSRIFMGTTPLPLPLVSAALASLDVLRRDRALRRRLQENATRLKSTLRRAGWTDPMLDSPAPIIRVVPHDDSDARRLRQALLRAAIYPSFTRYGNGPAAFRFVVSSAHTPAQVDRLASVLAAPV